MKVSLALRLGLVAAAVAAAGMAGAQPAGGLPGFGEHRPPFERALGPQGAPGHWWNHPSMVEKLKLTDAQRKAMDEILQQHRETLIDLRANVEKAELAMEPLMRDDQPNEARILAQIDKVAQARAELEKANARFLLAIRGKLTPEQWKTLQADRANHEPRRREMEPGGQRPGGAGRQLPPMPPLPPGPQGHLEDEPGPEGPASGINP